MFNNISDLLAQATVHCPGQCLPKANAATVHKALQNWAVWAPDDTCSEFLGGPQLAGIMKTVPLMIVVTVSDAHPSNDCIHALEEQRMSLGEASNKDHIVARLPALCLQHQSALAKRPALLSIPGLCSSLVRMSAIVSKGAFGVRGRSVGRSRSDGR